jgi:hypothetical protein
MVLKQSKLRLHKIKLTLMVANTNGEALNEVKPQERNNDFQAKTIKN